jgi:drug/metabolite transporter (DMT)-like permease
MTRADAMGRAASSAASSSSSAYALIDDPHFRGSYSSSSSSSSSSEGFSDNTKGLLLAIGSSLCIGASFIIKKKGLKLSGSRANARRAGDGGFGYLNEPLWWVGMLSMILGEVANFAAYAFAPAIVVTPLGALSIIISAVLSHYVLNEKLNSFGWLGCALCIVGSANIVLHAPEEKEIESIKEVVSLMLQPTFLSYSAFVLMFTFVLITQIYPIHGTTQLLVPIGICSLVGSLSVMSVKTLGLALKMTFEGNNQMREIETWVMIGFVIFCVLTQMNYLNKALDTFNTAIVTPIYYVCFTTLTLTASSIMFKDYLGQGYAEVLSQMIGFVVIVSGVFILNVTKDIPQETLNRKRWIVTRQDSREFENVQEEYRDSMKKSSHNNL